MAPCKFFSQGRCTFGASCKNSHEAVDANSATHRTVQKDSRRSVESKAPCWYFAEGKCTYGANCRSSHDMENHSLPSFERPVGTIKAEAESWGFDPGFGAQVLAPEHPQTVTQLVTPCIFFASGYCRNGTACSFSHDQPELSGKADSISPITVFESETNKLAENLSKIVISSSFTKNIHGSTAFFDNTGKIIDVKLVSDFSAVQILGLDANARIADVQNILSIIDFDVPASCIILKPVERIGVVAEIKVEDAAFAKAAMKSFEAHGEEFKFFNISMRALNSSAKHGSLENRLQLNTVTCTWFHASRVAYLTYNGKMYHARGKAENAEVLFRSSQVLGRRVECTLQETGFDPLRKPYVTLQLGNLHPETSDQDLLNILADNCQPARITIGDASHKLSEKKAAEIVENALRNKGALQSFQLHPPSGSKSRATAIFVDRGAATKAVEALNNTAIDRDGACKIFVTQLVAIKYNVLKMVAKALKNDIEDLKTSSWKNGFVHLKTYPQTDALKPYISLRISGEDVKMVSHAKKSLEKLLAGDVVMNGDVKLWDPYFTQPICLSYLNELSTMHQVYIYRDARKAQLRVFGGTTASISNIQAALQEQLTALSQHSHVISLTANLLQKAMHGGMRRLKQRFGDAVKLHISSNPKTITITGSTADFNEAQRILSQPNQIANNEYTAELEDCAVCWTEATEPLRTPCSHNYCKDCFAGQVSSAGGSDLPITCCGAGGNCEYTFNNEELKAMLSFAAYEDFLQRSFDDYIRTRPNEFRYCPTPDCPQIYRFSLTNEGEIFLCSECLTPVCTSCNVIAHDGISCEDYKDISSEGTKAFRKWAEENDVRPCPNCKRDVEKDGGCGHVACNCGIHICWFCMQTYATSDECYAHMGKIHGDFY